MPFWPNAVGLQYGLHGLGRSQRLSVISRIKGAEQWPACQKFAACKSESLTALTDSDCKLTALLQFTRDWIKLRFCIPSDGIDVQGSTTSQASASSASAASSFWDWRVGWAISPAIDGEYFRDSRMQRCRASRSVPLTKAFPLREVI